MIQLSHSWLAVVVDISVKSLGVALTAGLVIVLLRLRDTNLRHRIWTGVLLGMLAMPLLVLLTRNVAPAVPLPGWLTLDWQTAPPATASTDTPLNRPAKDALAAASSDARQLAVGSQPGNIPPSAGPIEFNAFEGFGSSPVAGPHPTPLPEAAERKGEPDEPSPQIRPIEQATPENEWSPRTWLARSWPILMMGTYTLVAFSLLMRFLVGTILTYRLVRESRPVDPYTLPSSKGPNVQFLEHPQVYVPLTAGVLRPAIMLPGDWRNWSREKLQAVLTHELAHVRRADWLVAMLAELNRAVHWFHPLAWFLKKRLSTLAEQNCDDAVLEADADRTQYARYLLEVAASLSASGSRCRALLHNVAMARTPSVETRIDAILDPGRPLARKLGAIGVACILAVGIPAVMFAAALRPAADSDQEPAVARDVEPEVAAANDPEPPIDEGEETTGASAPAVPTNLEDDAAPRKQPARSERSPLVYEGQVLTPDGKPAAGATLHLVYWYSYAESSAHHNPVAETDEDGRFRFEMSRGDFHRTGDSVPPWQWASLVAVKDGYGLAWAHSLAFEETGAVLEEMSDPGHPASSNLERLEKMIAERQRRLELVRDDLPVRGTIIDTEGQPVAGARIRVLELYQGQDGTLDAWTQAAKDSRADFYSVRQTVPYHLYGTLAEKLISPVETDEDGKFTIQGVGRERLVRLLVEAPHSEWVDIYCRTRPAETMEIGSGTPERTMFIHGSEFSHVVIPSKPVVGVVQDKTTGEPLAGVTVQSRKSWMHSGAGKATRGGNEFSRVVTDEKGMYELHGLPKSERNPVHFIPSREMPLLPLVTQVDTQGPGVEPVVLDAELERGIVVTGRVTDEETGRGVSGQIFYQAADEDLPASDRRRSNSTWVVSAGEPVRSDIQGHFRLVVPPDTRALAFKASDDTYQKSGTEAGMMRMVGGMLHSTGGAYHATAKLDPSSDTMAQHVEMQVSRGRIVTGTVLDSAGRPLDGGQYAGRTDTGGWRPIHDGKFFVANYDPSQPRRVTFVHREMKLAGTRVLRGELKDDVRVRLQPWGTITGRVVDERGDPIRDLRITPGSMDQILLNASRDASAETHRIVPLPPADDYGATPIQTDEDGRFTIRGLVPGVEFNLSGFQQSGSIETRKSGNIALGVIVEPGQALDLGDVTLEEPDLSALRRAAEQRADETEKRKDQADDDKEG